MVARWCARAHRHSGSRHQNLTGKRASRAPDSGARGGADRVRKRAFAQGRTAGDFTWTGLWVVASLARVVALATAILQEFPRVACASGDGGRIGACQCERNAN